MAYNFKYKIGDCVFFHQSRSGCPVQLGIITKRWLYPGGQGFIDFPVYDIAFGTELETGVEEDRICWLPGLTQMPGPLGPKSREELKRALSEQYKQLREAKQKVREIHEEIVRLKSLLKEDWR